MMRNLSLVVLGFTALARVQASWQFLSRPDLSTPVLNITQLDADKVAPGYLFVAPFAGGSDHEKHSPLQPGPYIYTSQGDLVWTGFAQYFSIWTVNLQKTKFKGKDALFAFQGKHNAAHGHGHGHIKILDSSYRTVGEVRAGHHRLIDKHEGQILDDGKSALVQIYQPVARDLSEVGGDDDHQWIVDAQFQEIDVESGDVLFEWHSLDHVPPSHSNISLQSGQAGDGSDSSEAWDYFHINSVDKDADGHYLLSARDVNSVYKVHGRTGKIIWRLGGRNEHSDFQALDQETSFSYQHHARFQGRDKRGREIISLYDNSAHGTETDGGSEVRDAPTSFGKILALDHKEKTVETIQAFYPPFSLLSKSQGSTHVLPSGNVLVNWGSEGAVTEYTSDGTAIFHAFFDSGKLAAGVQNYRAFKSEWTGRPTEEAAVAGLLYSSAPGGKLVPYSASSSTAKLLVAASWNGDTEVATWRFVARDGQHKIKKLGEDKRRGFETRILVDLELGVGSHELSQVRAEGLDRKGRILTETRWEKIEHDRAVPPEFRAGTSHLPSQKKNAQIVFQHV